MRRYLHTTLHPDMYHGHGKKPPFFEGWYYKLIDASEQHRYAIIPGVFLSSDPRKQHAFIQVLDGMRGHATYHTFPFEAFRASQTNFDVRIGLNHFTASHITLQIKDNQRALSGELDFEGINPWPVTWTSPGVMGWYGWLPFMECYHGVVSFDHTIHGALSLDEQTIDFSSGHGYIEKDWGQAFPSAYVWMQSNHFPTPGSSLSASIAMIPSIGRTFRGFIVGLWTNQTLYRFATYTGATTEKLEITDEHVSWTIRDRQHDLELLAVRASGGLLRGPARTEMHRRVDETLQATVVVHLSSIQDGQMIFSSTGRNAGLEVNGDIEKLLNTR